MIKKMAAPVAVPVFIPGWAGVAGRSVQHPSAAAPRPTAAAAGVPDPGPYHRNLVS